MSVSHFRQLFEQLMVGYKGVPVGKDVWYMPWSREDECITAIQLQKSNWSKLFYVNILVYTRGAFGWNVSDLTEAMALWERGRGGGAAIADRRLPSEFNPACDLQSSLSDEERRKQLSDAVAFLDIFSKRAKSRSGVRLLAEDELLFLTPPALAELDRLDAEAIN